MATTAELRFNIHDAPALPELHSSRQKLKDVLQPSYWESVCPGLHCGDQQFVAKLKAIDLDKQRLADLEQQINVTGVAQVGSEELPWSIKPGQLAAAVVSLIRYGWPPSLIMMYDEVWAIIQQASGLMRDATGGNTCNMDILAWYVDPNRGDVGFSPHRDRQPDHSPATFRPDGTAMYATLWLPLTDATPENSCLYVIPRFADPGYYEGDPDDAAAPDPLTAALPNKEAYQHIRALPCTAGSACIFTHRTIHWGSKGRPGYHTPRISMSWGCADDAYEPAYFSRAHLPCPPVELRLALAAAQMIVYHERFPAPPKLLALYYNAFGAQAGQFDSAYCAKVKREFLDASKEATAAAAAAAGKGQGSRKAPAAAEETAAGKAGGRSKVNEKASVAAAEEEGSHAGLGKLKTGRAKAVASPAKTTAAAAAAAAFDGGAAAAAAADKDAQGNSKKRKKGSTAKQQQQQQVEQQPGIQGSMLRRNKAMPPAKYQKQQQQGKNAAAAAVGVEQQEPSESEDEGDGIDWAKVTAAAKEAARKAKAKAKHKGKKGSAAAAAAESDSSSDESDDGLRFGDDDDGSDVMDMALDAVLDAQLAGEDFHDDFEDE